MKERIFEIVCATIIGLLISTIALPIPVFLLIVALEMGSPAPYPSFSLEMYLMVLAMMIVMFTSLFVKEVNIKELKKRYQAKTMFELFRNMRIEAKNK